MGNVEVAAGHDGLLGGESREEGAEARVPGEARLDALESRLRVGDIGAHEPVAGELERAHAALVVGLGAADVPDDAERLLAREDGGARVALAVGVAPCLHVAGKVEAHLSLLELGLLDGDGVGIKSLGYLDEAGLLAEDGPQPVDVPRDEPELPFAIHVRLPTLW